MMKERDVLKSVEGLTVTRLQVCIEEEWVRPAEPLDGSEGERVFDELDIARLRLISELVDDLAVNNDAVPIILSLIDQAHALDRRLRALQEAVSGLDDAVTAEIAARLKAAGVD